MTSAAGGGLLRRLADDIRALTAVPQAQGAHHPLGLGIPEQHHWLFADSSKVVLPVSALALEQLLRTVRQEIYGLAAEHREAAWRALLTSPAYGYLLPGADKAEWSDRGITVPQHVDADRLRHVVLLGAVAADRPTFTDGILDNEPVVGVAELLIAADAADSATHAWVSARWSTSAADTIEALETVQPHLGTAHGLGKPIRRRRGVTVQARMPDPASMTLVLPPSARHTTLTSDLDARIRAAGGVAGFAVTTVCIGPRCSQPTRMLTERMTHSPPSVLVIADASADDAADVVSAYTHGNAAGRVFTVRFESGGPGFLPRLRSLLAALAGVSANNLPLGPYRPVSPGAPTPAPTTRKMPPFPVTSAARTLQHDVWGPFVKDSATKYWYARDRAGHAERTDDAGPVGQFKRFTETATGLSCDASTDAKGTPLEGKHESSVGSVVPFSELHG